MDFVWKNQIINPFFVFMNLGLKNPNWYKSSPIYVLGIVWLCFGLGLVD